MRQLNNPKNGKQARSISPGRILIEVANLLDLGVEIAVAVKDALGRTGASGGENHRRRVVGRGGGNLAAGPRLAAQLSERRAPPKPSPADGHVPAGLRKSLLPKCPHGVDDGNGDEPLRLRLGQTVDQVAQPHARVDEDRHGPGLEDGEGQGDEIDTGPDEQNEPRAMKNPHFAESAGDPVAVLVELGEGDAAIEPLSIAAVAQRFDDGDAVGHGLGHSRQSPGDIDNHGVALRWGNVTVRPKGTVPREWPMSILRGSRPSSHPLYCRERKAYKEEVVGIEHAIGLR